MRVSRPPARKTRMTNPSNGPMTRGRQKFAGHLAPLQPAIRDQEHEHGEENEGGVLLRDHHEAEAKSVRQKPAPVARCAQIFPERPESEERPKGEEAVHERMLRHVNLRRRKGDERGDPERGGRSLQAPGENRREKERENAEERSNVVQSGQAPPIRKADARRKPRRCRGTASAAGWSRPASSEPRCNDRRSPGIRRAARE